MYTLCLDTCTWIYIANGTEPVKFLKFIAQEIDKNNITVLVPEIIITEWNRNKEDTVEKGTIKHFDQVFKSLKRIQRLLGETGKKPVSFLFYKDEEDKKEYFEDLVKKLESKQEDVKKSIQENIAIIDLILSHPNTIKIGVNDKVKSLAGEHAILKKAPFGERNSYADAIIFFSFIEYIREHEIEGAFFITYNTEDFCLKDHGKKSLHPDLHPYMDETKSEFFTIVGKALKRIETDITTKEEIALIEEMQKQNADDWKDVEYCTACGDNDRYSELNFSEPFEIFNVQAKHGFNPGQLSLTFSEPLPIPSKALTINTIQIAKCNGCGTEYFKCQSCHTTNAVDDRYNKRIECEGCGLGYLIEYSYMDIKDGGEPTYNIVGDERDERECDSCGSSYEFYGIENGMCKECEDKHLTA